MGRRPDSTNEKHGAHAWDAALLRMIVSAVIAWHSHWPGHRRSSRTRHCCTAEKMRQAAEAHNRSYRCWRDESEIASEVVAESRHSSRLRDLEAKVLVSHTCRGSIPRRGERDSESSRSFSLTLEVLWGHPARRRWVFGVQWCCRTWDCLWEGRLLSGRMR